MSAHSARQRKLIAQMQADQERRAARLVAHETLAKVTDERLTRYEREDVVMLQSNKARNVRVRTAQDNFTDACESREPSSQVLAPKGKARYADLHVVSVDRLSKAALATRAREVARRDTMH